MFAFDCFVEVRSDFGVDVAFDFVPMLMSMLILVSMVLNVRLIALLMSIMVLMFMLHLIWC